MRYFIVPIKDGLIDIDYSFLQEGVQSSSDHCYVSLREGFEVRESWQEITEEEFNMVKPVNPVPTTPIALDELKTNQLILMDAIATLFETVIGGA